MTAQELIVAAIGVATVAYLIGRWFLRRRAATCCGERECPATKAVAERLQASRDLDRDVNSGLR